MPVSTAYLQDEIKKMSERNIKRLLRELGEALVEEDEKICNEAADEIERLTKQLDRAEAAMENEAIVTRDLREQLVSATQWRSIETAPRDGTDVIAVENDVVGEAYFNIQDDNWWWANTDPHDFDPSHAAYPTHWMPLPEPPALTYEQAKPKGVYCKTCPNPKICSGKGYCQRYTACQD